jgi:hypothetical protein
VRRDHGESVAAQQAQRPRLSPARVHNVESVDHGGASVPALVRTADDARGEAAGTMRAVDRGARAVGGERAAQTLTRQRKQSVK